MHSHHRNPQRYSVAEAHSVTLANRAGLTSFSLSTRPSPYLDTSGLQEGHRRLIRASHWLGRPSLSPPPPHRPPPPHPALVMGAAASSQAFDSPEQVAAKLARRQPCVLAFLSPQCGLCSSLRPALDQVSVLSQTRWFSASDSGDTCSRASSQTGCVPAPGGQQRYGRRHAPSGGTHQRAAGQDVGTRGEAFSLLVCHAHCPAVA